MAFEPRVKFHVCILAYQTRKIQIASIRNENARIGLGTLLRILRGDKNAISEVSESWQEYVASMAFFSIPFNLDSYKDVRQLYDDAMKYDFNIDNTLASEVASSALFTCDLPRVLAIFICNVPNSNRLWYTFSKQILLLLCMYPISYPKAGL